MLDGASAGAKLAITDEGVVGGLGAGERLDAAVERDGRGLLAQGLSVVRSYSASGEMLGAELGVYIQAFATPPTMVIFGAIDFSVAVARLAESSAIR